MKKAIKEIKKLVKLMKQLNKLGLEILKFEWIATSIALVLKTFLEKLI